MDFAERITELRREKGFTQKQLAKATNLSEIGIRKYEGRTREPAFQQLLCLAEFFDVSLDYLVGRSNNPQRF